MLYDPKWKNTTTVQQPRIEPWRDHLRGAAAIIRKHGLAQYSFRGDNGSYCTLGAIAKAATGEEPGNEIDYQSIEAARRFAKMVVQSGYVGSICNWNNAYARTKDDVIAALEACAAA